jgi:uncharacterized Zn finger protein
MHIPAGLIVEENEDGLCLCCDCERDVEFVRMLNISGCWTYECQECGQLYDRPIQSDEPAYYNVITDAAPDDGDD